MINSQISKRARGYSILDSQSCFVRSFGQCQAIEITGQSLWLTKLWRQGHALHGLGPNLQPPQPFLRGRGKAHGADATSRGVLSEPVVLFLSPNSPFHMIYFGSLKHQSAGNFCARWGWTPMPPWWSKMVIVDGWFNHQLLGWAPPFFNNRLFGSPTSPGDFFGAEKPWKTGQCSPGAKNAQSGKRQGLEDSEKSSRCSVCWFVTMENHNF